VFDSVDREYTALRESSALVDLSGVGLIDVRGPDALEFVQRAFTRDVEYLTPDRSLTGLVLDEAGAPQDVATVYKSEGGFTVETAVGCGPATLAAFERLIGEMGLSVTLAPSSDVAVAVEGPQTWRHGEAAIGVNASGLPFEGVMHATWSGRDILISRTGYTSEYGFKVQAPEEVALELWPALAAHSVPAGHQALEITMLEVRQPRLHRELGSDPSVIGSGLNWLVDMEKGDFVGRDALAAAAAMPVSRMTVGFAVESEALPQPGATVALGDQVVGSVIDAVRDPGLATTIGLIGVEPAIAASGLELELVGAEGERQLIKTLSSPYRVPTSWAAIKQG